MPKYIKVNHILMKSRWVEINQTFASGKSNKKLKQWISPTRS